jgi:hypothetical protein
MCRIPHLYYTLEEGDLLPDYICSVPNRYSTLLQILREV